MNENNVSSKMTALADEIRELSGTTTPKSIDEMTSDVDMANTEINEQTDLLEQIATALEGKASGGSSGGEDVTAETNAYTEKITQLKTAVTELENELAGKAGGGSGGNSSEVEFWITVEGDMPPDATLLYGYFYTGPSGNKYVDIGVDLLSALTEEYCISLPVGGYIMINHSPDYYLEYGCHDCDWMSDVPLNENYTIVGDFIVVTGNNPRLTIYFGGNN